MTNLIVIDGKTSGGPPPDMPDEAELHFDRAYREWMRALADYERPPHTEPETVTEAEAEALTAHVCDRFADAERQTSLAAGEHRPSAEAKI